MPRGNPTTGYTVRLTAEDRARFERAAQDLGLSLGAFLRKAGAAFCSDCWRGGKCYWCGHPYYPLHGQLHEPDCPAVKHVRFGGGE